MEDILPASREMLFKWTADGTVPTWTNWYRYEPSDSQSAQYSEDCVHMNGSYGGLWRDEPCTTTLPAFFCSAPAQLGPMQTTTVISDCQRSSELPTALFDGYCYYFNWLHALPYDFAQSQCKSYGGNLVSIYSQ